MIALPTLFSGIAGRAIGALVIAAALIAAAFWIRHQGVVAGRAEIQAAWDADTSARTAAALAAEQAARAAEQALQTRLRKVANDYQAERARRAAADSAAADSLRQLQAALDGPGRTDQATADPAPAPGADDDPRSAIITECARAATELDSAARSLASQTVALQEYARSVCVSPPD